MQIAYIPSENVLPRTRVLSPYEARLFPRSQTAPQRFNRIYTVSRSQSEA